MWCWTKEPKLYNSRLVNFVSARNRIFFSFAVNNNVGNPLSIQQMDGILGMEKCLIWEIFRPIGRPFRPLHTQNTLIIELTMK